MGANQSSLANGPASLPSPARRNYTSPPRPVVNMEEDPMDLTAKGVKRAAMVDAEADPVSTITSDILRQIQPHKSKIRLLQVEMEEEQLIIRNLEAALAAASASLKGPANSNDGASPATHALQSGDANDVPMPADSKPSDSKPTIPRKHYVMPESSSLLEELLFKWHMRLELQGTHVSRNDLQNTATDIFNRIPEVRAEASAIPEFNLNWASLYQQRCLPKIQRATEMHRDFFDAHERMLAVRERAATLPRGNVYTMGVTGFSWRQTPCPMLTRAKFSGDPQRRHITLALTTNELGETEFPVWAIGQLHAPVALRKFNHEALQVKWRANGRGHMTVDVMMDWLVDFYEYIMATRPGQHVLLMLDDVDTARIAVGLRSPPDNIMISYFPKCDSCDSYHSPMNSGIISTFKMHYRQIHLSWLTNTMRESDVKNGADPIRDMDLRRALTWVSEAWFYYLQTNVAENSFMAAQVRVRTAFSNDIAIPEYTKQQYAKVLPWAPGKLQLEEFIFGTDEDVTAEVPQSMPHMLETVLQDWRSYLEDATEFETDPDGQDFRPPKAVSAQEAVGHIKALMRMIEANDMSVEPLELALFRSWEGNLERMAAGAESD